MHTFAAKQGLTQEKASSGLVPPRAATQAPARHARPLLNLQRGAGNQAVQRLLRGGSGAGAPAIQFKLSVSSPDDAFEREADDVADKVMRMERPSQIGQAPPSLWRKCAACEGEEGRRLAAQSEEDEESPAQAEEEEEPGQGARTLLARQASHGAAAAPSEGQGVEGAEEEYPAAGQSAVFLKAAAGPRQADEAAGAVEGRLNARQSGGEPLADSTRRGMEEALGYDFSRVRVHRDAEAGQISRQLGAHAFTQGSNIYFGSGAFDPSSPSGKRLLAHELTHVVQQGQAARLQGGGGAAPASAGRAPEQLLQRRAVWARGAVHQVNNLANVLLTGGAVGVTWPTLNGRTFWSTAETRAQIARPTLTFTPVAAPGVGVEARVNTVPTNTGSFDETVLARGPWRVNVPRATVGARFPALAACTGAGNTNFRAIGDPSDNAMFQANRRHENRHASDHRRAFDRSVRRWDRRLRRALARRRAFRGADNAAAEAALYAAMGGTPDQVADDLFNRCQAAVIAYHGTPRGGGVTTHNPRANADCSTSSVRSRNPS